MNAGEKPEPMRPVDWVSKIRPGAGSRQVDPLELLETRPAGAAWPRMSLRYVFEHLVLRDAAFKNHPDLLLGLGQERPTLSLEPFWTKALNLCNDPTLDEAAAKALQALFKVVGVHAFRVHQRDGYTLYAITMPAPSHTSETHVVAIVNKDDEPRRPLEVSPSTRYFTLEKTANAAHTMLCEWTPSGQHRNHGGGPNPEVGAFVDAVFGRVRTTSR